MDTPMAREQLQRQDEKLSKGVFICKKEGGNHCLKVNSTTLNNMTWGVADGGSSRTTEWQGRDERGTFNSNMTAGKKRRRVQNISNQYALNKTT